MCMLLHYCVCCFYKRWLLSNFFCLKCCYLLIDAYLHKNSEKVWTEPPRSFERQTLLSSPWKNLILFLFFAGCSKNKLLKSKSPKSLFFASSVLTQVRSEFLQNLKFKFFENLATVRWKGLPQYKSMGTQPISEQCFYFLQILVGMRGMTRKFREIYLLDPEVV